MSTDDKINQAIQDEDTHTQATQAEQLELNFNCEMETTSEAIKEIFSTLGVQYE